jgi:hypothetical protein
MEINGLIQYNYGQINAQVSKNAQPGEAALKVSRQIAAARAAEGARPDSLFSDPFAVTLAQAQPAHTETLREQQEPQGEQGREQHEQQLDAIATRYIDESLLNAMSMTSVNTIQSGEYRQVCAGQEPTYCSCLHCHC